MSLGIHTQADLDGVSTGTVETRQLKGWSLWCGLTAMRYLHMAGQ